MTGLTIQRATHAGFATGLNSVNVAAAAVSLAQTVLTRNTTNYLRIRANDGTIISSAWQEAAPITINP